MTQTHYQMNQNNELATQIISSGKKIIKIAGASASGKTTVAQDLVSQLQSAGKKVLMISSDNYYQDHTRLQAVVYGSFDHPSLIKYNQLYADLQHYLETYTRNYPQYSFKDSRVISYQNISWYYDIVIIEGLYTISQLPPIAEELNIIITSDTEELMIRRLIRDQQRTKDTASQIVQTLESVFSMRNVFGKMQEQQADIIIHNDYDILHDKGTVVRLIACQKPWTVWDTYQHHNYIYDDPHHTDKDRIQITEVYPKTWGMLDHTSLYKLSQKHDHQWYKQIWIDFQEYGMVAQLHTLMQLAGLQVIKHDIQERYRDENSHYLVQDQQRYQEIIG